MLGLDVAAEILRYRQRERFGLGAGVWPYIFSISKSVVQPSPTTSSEQSSSAPDNNSKSYPKGTHPNLFLYYVNWLKWAHFLPKSLLQVFGVGFKSRVVKLPTCHYLDLWPYSDTGQWVTKLRDGNECNIIFMLISFSYKDYEKFVIFKENCTNIVKWYLDLEDKLNILKKISIVFCIGLIMNDFYILGFFFFFY